MNPKNPKIYDAVISPFSRRALLRGAAMIPAATVLTRCADDPHELDPAYEALPVTREGKVFFAQYPKGVSAIEKAAEHLDFSWLGAGDSVLLKVASNSAKAHPATTHPDAIKGMVKVLKDRGAGRIIVADQAGIQWVIYRQDGYRTDRNTQSVFESNGIAQAARDAGAELHAFDDEPFDTGYFAATPPAISHWKNGIFVPNIIQEVDHIVYLPRLSSHAVTGYTMALKLSVGWMRDDTRMEFHQKGKSLYEKYTQVNYCAEIKNRLRMIFTYVDTIQLDIGPDDGTRVPLPEGLIIATGHPGDHDVLGAALMLAVDDLTPSPLDLVPVYPEMADYWNHFLVEYWGEEATQAYERHRPASFWQGVRHDPAIRHSYVLDGERPRQITVTADGTPLPPPIQSSVDRFDSGLLKFVRA